MTDAAPTHHSSLITQHSAGKHLVLSRAAIGPRMASPGIRAYHIASSLGRLMPESEITLGIPGDFGEVPALPGNVKTQIWTTNGEAAALARAHDVTVSRNFPPQFARLLGERRFALDAFTPFFIEWMEFSQLTIESKWRRTWMAGNRWYLNFQLSLADFIFCADDRQRDMWIGMLMALALVPPDTYERDPSLRRLIDLVPYGVRPGIPEAGQPGLKGVVQGIEKTDRVLLWNGSVTEWNDPVTLLKAMENFARRRPEIKLVFMGVNHPDYVFGPKAGVLREAIQTAKDMGLEGRSVFFLEGWVPYERIDDYLAEADVSVCLGYENIESRFAFRTRYVDVFRSRVPLLCTQGDVLAERVGDDPLGIAVAEGDVAAVTEGIERLLDDAGLVAECRRNLGTIGSELAWDTAVQPLADFCASDESFAMPANRRRRETYTRAAGYFFFKKICRSAPQYW